jgi:hypothetical protein
MAYTKPQIVAQNSAQGSFAAGCPEKDTALLPVFLSLADT